MEDSLRGFMAAFAVSGGVVFIAMHAHNRLLSDFINKMEFQINSSTERSKNASKKQKKKKKKKVRFADDVVAESTVEKNSAAVAAGRNNAESLEAIPENWQVLYRGILQSRNIH